jgi:TonB-linked SusC/RagA family outer membrane protein
LKNLYYLVFFKNILVYVWPQILFIIFFNNLNNFVMKRFLLLSVVICSFLVTGVMAQEKTISGRVVAEENGTPIPGVNVILKGTTIGTVSDIDGNYKLNVPAEGGILVYSFIGLATEEVRIGNQSVIDMVMTADIKQLSEVVVTAIGLESEKAALGFSIQTVGAEEVQASGETNIVSALNQKAAGVYVYQNAGTPGASASIRIRGNTSVNLSNTPLFVVDGVPIDNSDVGNGTGGANQSNRAIDINPNDIASMTVLKGPAATVLYGIRASSGAIIITTKKGSVGKPKVTFSSSYAASQVNKLVEKQYDYAQGRPVGGVPTWRGPDTNDGFSWGPKISDLEFATDPGHPNAPGSGGFDSEGNYKYDDNGFLVPVGSGNGQPANAYRNNDNFFVTGNTFDNNLSVSGGTSEIKYYLSAGYLNQTGVVPLSKWERVSLLAKISADIADNFEIGAQANYINSGGYRPQQGSNVNGVMLGLMRNSATFDAARGYTNGRDAANDINTYEFPDGTQRSYRPNSYDSPFWTVNNNPYNDNVNRLIGNINFNWRVLPWMSITYKLGIDTYHDRRINGYNINSNGDFSAGMVYQQDISNTDLNSDLLFLFNHDFSEKLGLNATLGWNFFDTRYHRRWSQGDQMSVPKFYHISNTASVQAGEVIGEKQISGVFADVKLSWDNYLFLNASVRNDWSSALPEDNNSYLYPAVSLGWTFTENLGLSTSTIFSYGKLRASWGQVGNDAPIYSTTTPFTQANMTGDGFINGVNFPAFNVNSFELSNSLGNPDLEAELTTTIEFGAEFQFFQGRLGFDVTWYDSYTDGQVINIDVAPSTGFNGLLGNAGKVSNTGWEVMFNATPIVAGDFTWDMNINFTAYETMVDELDPSIGEGGISLAGFTSTTSRVIAGQPYGIIYGNRYQRVEGGANDGRLIIGADGWPIAAPDQGILGDPNPDWLAGWRNTFTWKGITLSGLLDFRQGGKMWNGTAGVMNYFGVTEETGTDRNVQGYIFDGVVNVGTTEDPVYEQNNTPVDFADPAFGVGGTKWTRYGFGWSENEIEDASWVRLRDVTLAYDFPKSLFKSNIDLRISVSGRNLWLLTNYTGIDPETNLTGNSNGFGLDYFNMPNTKSYHANLTLTF